MVGVLGCLYVELHCPFGYGGNCCLQLLWAAWSEVVTFHPVRLWIHSVSSRDFSVRPDGGEI